MSLKAFLIASLAAVSFAAPTPVPQFGSFGGFGGSTKNDIVDGECKAISFFFARGTTETGNMGNSVGPALESALEKLYPGQVATQGAVYPADVAGTFIGSTAPGSAQGATFIAKYIKQIKQSCPKTKVVLGGYSQGAQQVHGALIDVSEGMVDAAVTFGDPLQAQAFKNIDKSHTKIFCNIGDGVCMDAFIISAAHLSYTTDGSIGRAASFIQSVIGTVGS